MEEFTRKLASIQKIISLSPIPEADQIEKAKISGWECVVKKGEFKEGDLCVYCEVDSLMPEDNPAFDFLKDSKGNMKRIRTVRLKGQISQGIAFPLSILKFPPNRLVNSKDCKGISTTATEFSLEYKNGVMKCISPPGGGYGFVEIVEGADVTNYLYITKYEPEIPAQLRGKVKGNRPDWVPKTDEPRVQNLGHIIQKYQEIAFYVTEKLDGTSCSFGYKDGEFVVCYRNMSYVEDDDNTYCQMAKKLDIKNILAQSQQIHEQHDFGYPGSYNYEYMKNIVIQGEIVGPGIQGNKYKLSHPVFFIFQIWCIKDQRFLNYEELKYACRIFKLDRVPIVEDRMILNHSTNQLIEMSNGKSILNKDTLREGLVFRPHLQEIYDEGREFHGGRVSFKCVSPEFLLKYGE